MYFNFIFILVFIFLGKGFFSWDEEYIIAIGLFLVIYFLYSLLKTSLFLSLNEQIDKIALKFMFFYTLNIIMLKILVNSFKREFELKNSIAYVYLYLNNYTGDFSAINKSYLISIYRSNINFFLSKLTAYNFEINKQFFFLSPPNKLSELNKFISNLEKLFFSNSKTSR